MSEKILNCYDNTSIADEHVAKCSIDYSIISPCEEKAQIYLDANDPVQTFKMYLPLDNKEDVNV